MRVLIVIPAYNEEETLAATVTNLQAVCPDIDYLVINDGSEDTTEHICQEQDFSHLTMPVNTGLASVFRTGMKYAFLHNYDAVVQFDADGQHLPEYIPKMAQVLEAESADIVIGSRILAGEAPVGLRNAGSKLISGLIKLTTSTTITDPTSGLRMYSRHMIELFATGFDIDPEPDMLAWSARHGARIIEIPAHIRERQGGESYLKAGAIIAYMMRACLSILMYQWLR